MDFEKKLAPPNIKEEYRAAKRARRLELYSEPKPELTFCESRYIIMRLECLLEVDAEKLCTNPNSFEFGYNLKKRLFIADPTDRKVALNLRLMNRQRKAKRS